MCCVCTLIVPQLNKCMTLVAMSGWCKRIAVGGSYETLETQSNRFLDIRKQIVVFVSGYVLGHQ